ncbi:MAG: 3'-5' exonuclease [Bacteroidales bacterium]|nr:3'-5' exonuclease [Bacteroidales bacterium]
MIDPKNILFLDIETVPFIHQYSDLSEEWQQLWDKKAKFLLKENNTPSEVYERAGIYAEFGKIVCISCGIIDAKNEVRIKSFVAENEKDLLNEFASMLNKFYNKPEQLLAAHNGKEFDFPYIARRMLINEIQIPEILNLSGKRPWEIKHIDTMELWKFGDYKHFTSLELLAKLFNIPTPKDDINGADVARVYYEEKDLDRIKKYCEKDVQTLLKVYLKLNSLDINNYIWNVIS